MKTVLPAFRTVWLPIAAASLFAVPAAAQPTADAEHRADALLARAETMSSQSARNFGRHRDRVADLYERAGRLLDETDPRAVESLARAGGLLMTADPVRSRGLLREAADLALANGDAARAASLYADVAWVVAQAPTRTAADVRAARECYERARRLAAGPALTLQQRQSILQRIGSDGFTVGRREALGS